MSEVNLTILEHTRAIQGEIHGSVVDAVIAALSAEPETISELEATLERYQKRCDGENQFGKFHHRLPTQIDPQPWDAGLVIVDLAARIVASESTYSAPSHQGEVRYHDGHKATEVPIYYRVPDDWLFLYSIDEYRGVRGKKLQERLANPPLDIHAFLYGPALTEFIVTECLNAQACAQQTCADGGAEVFKPGFAKAVAAIHADWLMTPRDELRGQSPREVMLAKREFIDFDLHTRMLQWSFLGEGPPCLAPDSYAFRYGGCGTHEWVVYYDLLRHLLVESWHRTMEIKEIDLTREISRLEKSKSSWLALPQLDLDGRIPSLIIENERRRLPIVVSSHEALDEDCPLCQMIAEDSEMGFGPTFWHLDGCNMDNEFVFSVCRTREEWEAERLKWETLARRNGTEEDVDLKAPGEPALVVEEPSVQ